MSGRFAWEDEATKLFLYYLTVMWVLLWAGIIACINTNELSDIKKEQERV